MARFSNPFPQYISGSSNVQAGSKLNFYETGTTTRKATFFKSDLLPANANPNPVIANADGFFGDMWLDGIYNVVLTDKDDVTIDDADPVGDTTEGQWESWLNDNTYNIPNIVLASDDNYYRSLVDGNQGNDPTSSPASWEQIELGRIWNIFITYGIGDSAFGSDGNLYKSETANNLGNNPVSDAINWSPGVKVDAAAFPFNSIAGFNTALNASEPLTDIDFDAGTIRDSTDTVDIVVEARIKQIDATWAAGTNAGGLADGASLAIDTEYYAFAVIAGGVNDIMWDDDIICSHGVANNDVTAFRHIRVYHLTDGSSDIVPYYQRGIHFGWAVWTEVFSNTSPGTAGLPITAQVPSLYDVIVDAVGFMTDSTGAPAVVFSSLDQTDEAPTPNTAHITRFSGTDGFVTVVPIKTVAGQFRARANVGSGYTQYRIATNTYTYIEGTT